MSPPTDPGSAALLMALDAAGILAHELGQAARTRQAVVHAQEVLEQTLSLSEVRAAFLEALAAERDAGRLLDEEYHHLLATAARILRTNADLVQACGQVVRRAR